MDWVSLAIGGVYAVVACMGLLVALVNGSAWIAFQAVTWPVWILFAPVLVAADFFLERWKN